MSNHTYDADMLDKLLADLINYKVFGDDERFVNINYIYHRAGAGNRCHPWEVV